MLGLIFLKERPVVVAPPAEPVEDSRVLAALRTWREGLRRRSSFLMLSDAELRALAPYKPTTVAEMAPRLPPEQLERYGTEILRVIEDATR